MVVLSHIWFRVRQATTEDSRWWQIIASNDNCTQLGQVLHKEWVDTKVKNGLLHVYTCGTM